MKIVDLNVLLYAANTDAPQHASCLRFWEDALSSDEPIGLAWVVVLGFLRVATHRGILAAPLLLEDALARVDRWLAQPAVRLLPAHEDHWPTLKNLLRETGMSGNATMDAHLAALAIENGATLVSCDNDFARFPRLRWENPVAHAR